MSGGDESLIMSAAWAVRRLLFSTTLLLLSLHAVLAAANNSFFDPYLTLLWVLHAFFFELEPHPYNDALVQLLFPFSLAGAFNATALAFASLSSPTRPSDTVQWIYLFAIPPLPLLLHLFFIFWSPLRSDVQRSYRLRSGHRAFVALKVLYALVMPLALYLIILRYGGPLNPAAVLHLSAKSTAFLVASLAGYALAALAFAYILLSRASPLSPHSPYYSSPTAIGPSASLHTSERTPLMSAINSGADEGGSLTTLSLTPSPHANSSVTKGGDGSTGVKKKARRLPASAVPPDAPLETRLEALLVSPPEYEIVSEILPLAPPDSLLRALVLFFDSRHQFMRLLKTFLLRDIRAAPAPEALLRDEGPAARLYQTFGALAAPGFLVPALSGPFAAFATWAESLHAQGDAPSSDLSALAFHANNIALAFVGTLETFPSAIRKVCRATHKGAVRRFGASAENASTNLLFLHLLCRALVYPENYRLLPSAPDAALRQAFFRPLSRLVYLSSVFESHPAPLDDPLMALVSVQMPTLPTSLHAFAVAARETPATAPKARLTGPLVEEATMELLRYVSANYGLLKRHLEEEA